MSKDHNEWEAKSIESELDKIRAKYLMSPSDFEKSSSFKYPPINNTGTFKQDKSSIDTRNQSMDNYGNEIREFIIDHPFKNSISQSSKKNASSFSKEPNSTLSKEDKENTNSFQEGQIIIEKPEVKPSYTSNYKEYCQQREMKIKTEEKYSSRGDHSW